MEATILITMPTIPTEIQRHLCISALEYTQGSGDNAIKILMRLPKFPLSIVSIRQERISILKFVTKCLLFIRGI